MALPNEKFNLLKNFILAELWEKLWALRFLLTVALPPGSSSPSSACVNFFETGCTSAKDFIVEKLQRQPIKSAIKIDFFIIKKVQ